MPNLEERFFLRENCANCGVELTLDEMRGDLCSSCLKELAPFLGM